MEGPRHVAFPPFRLDRKDTRLWRGRREVPLGGKAFDVLSFLAGRPGELVTKEELLDAVWPGTAVSEAVLTTAVRELRRSLGDAARSPRFVETVHGRGYRFIAPIEDRSAAGRSPEALYGREREWRILHEWLAAALAGTRRIGFLAGEPGIGKSALAEAFVAHAEGEGIDVACGQCVEPYGAGEPYLPLLEALGRLARGAKSRELARVLRTHAPSWLAHLPSLPSEGRVAGPDRATPTRMLRELADAFDVLTTKQPLVLLLEDLHWSDTATLEWLGYVARRRDPARLLVLATFRPVDVIVRGHPLRDVLSEMRRLPQVEEVVLDFLSEEAVGAYLRSRSEEAGADGGVVHALHEQSRGHPLFLVTIVDALGRDGRLGPRASSREIAGAVPASIRQFIERELERLPRDDRRILEAASVAGTEFPVAAVAAGCDLPEEQVEARCEVLGGEGALLHEAGSDGWPDGTLTARYRFRHDLWREVAYRGCSPGRRARLHRAIAGRLEAGHREHAPSLAAELSVHFEEGGDPARALLYRRLAGENASRRSAYREALDHLTRGRDLLERLPEGEERASAELRLSLGLGTVRMATDGWATAEVARIHEHARSLCRRLGDRDLELRALTGQISVSLVRGEIRKTRELSHDLLSLATEARHRSFRMMARMELAGTDLLAGNLADARAGFRETLGLYEAEDHRLQVLSFGMDLGVFACAWSSHAHALLDDARAARERVEESLARARELEHPFSLAIALAYAAMSAQLGGDADATRFHARAAAELCREQGFPYYLAWARMLHGWAEGCGGSPAAGIAEIREGIAAFEATGGRRSLAYFRGLLVDTLLRAGDVGEAMQELRKAFALLRAGEERWWESELHRLDGAVRIGTDPVAAAASFRRALEVASAQGARCLELRAAAARQVAGRELPD